MALNFNHLPANVISLAQALHKAQGPLFPPLEKCAFEAKTAPLMMYPQDMPIGSAPYDIPPAIASAVYRTDNMAPLGVVGQRYAIAQNADLQTAVAEAAENSLPRHALQDIELQEFTSRGGAYTRFEYTFPALGADIRQLSGSSTQLKFRIGVVNSFNGAGSIRGFAGAYDLVCTNGMVIGEFETSAFRHSSGFDPKRLGIFIEAEAAKYVERVRTWQAWAQKRINSAEAETALDAAGMSGRRIKTMMQQFEIEAANRGASVWALYSALTYYSSHNSARFGVRNSANVDNVAETLDKREREIAQVIASPAFQRLAA